MIRKMQLLGAYGRHYHDGMSALKDWYAGKDFQIMGGPYCSIRDMDALASYGVDIEILIGKAPAVKLYTAPADLLAGII